MQEDEEENKIETVKADKFADDFVPVGYVNSEYWFPNPIEEEKD